MLNTTRPSQAKTIISITLSPGCSTEPLQTGAPSPPPLASFPVSRCTLDEHPRLSAWAGLSEAGQILAEAEAHKGGPLTLEELRIVMVAHLDVYDPNWSFHHRGIADEWMSGWEHAFALYAQQAARARCPEPSHGIGLLPRVAATPSAESGQPRIPVRFSNATILVADPQAFFQGVWEGQLAALDEQGVWAAIDSSGPGTAARPLTAAWCFDELLDLVYETGNYGLEYVVGYVLGYSEGLLSGRTFPPARFQESAQEAPQK